jgi:surfactin synthase thioesterase subunit
MKSAPEERWFPFTPADLEPSARLFCVPHGGSGAGAFQQWPSLVPGEIEVVPVALPGRERRFREPSATSVEELASALLHPLLHRAGSVPFAILGHSLGALVAYQVTRALAALGRPPVQLVVSGAVPPHVPSPVPSLRDLPDDEFLMRVLDLGGFPREVLENPRFVAMIVPVLRIDFRATETYECHEVLSNVPLTALGGDDDLGVPEDLVARWADLTTGPAEIQVLRGDHFFLYEHQAAVLADVAAAVLARVGSGAPR